MCPWLFPVLCPSEVVVVQEHEADSHGWSLYWIRSVPWAPGSSGSPCLHAPVFPLQVNMPFLTWSRICQEGSRALPRISLRTLWSLFWTPSMKLSLRTWRLPKSSGRPRVLRSWFWSTNQGESNTEPSQLEHGSAGEGAGEGLYPVDFAGPFPFFTCKEWRRYCSLFCLNVDP